MQSIVPALTRTTTDQRPGDMLHALRARRRRREAAAAAHAAARRHQIEHAREHASRAYSG